MPHEHWYDVVEEDHLRQGDIFRSIRCFWFADTLAPEPEDAQVRHRVGDWIVAQASCDMDTGRFPQVLLIPLVTASRESLGIAETAADDEYMKRLEVIRRGGHPRRFLLPEKPEEPAAFPLSVAAWDTVVAMPRQYLMAHCCQGARLRLRHPFREKFGNWIGEKLSAIGPETEWLIPPFRKRVHDAHFLDAGDALG